MRNHDRRLLKVERQILSLPIAPEVVKKAFAQFQKAGELPEDQRVAYAVVQRAKRGAKMSDLFESTKDWGTLIEAQLEEPKRPKDEVMDSLYNEAVFAPELLRSAARHVLKDLATKGMDVTTPAFTERGIKLDLPDYGSVGLHMVGFPARLARPPYVRQAKRLFARLAKLRKRIPQDDRRWFDRLGDATQAFQFNGERSEDELVLDAVLALGEIDTLMDHAVGEDVGEPMAAFDAAARAKADEREAAIARLQEMAREGRFLPQQDASIAAPHQASSFE